MHKTLSWLIAAAATSGTAMGETPAATDSQLVELTRQINDLQREVEHLRRSGDDDWLTEQRAEDIRGLVQDVLADADTRASLLSTGMSAGYDKGFFIGSDDGAYKLKIGGQLQVRYVYNSQDMSADDNIAGFENRRSKIKMSGHVVDPSWSFLITAAADRDRGGFVLEDTYIEKALDNGMTVRVGQFKAPFAREELVSSSKQTAVDRSLVNEAMNQRDRSQGIQVGWEGDQLSVDVAWIDGTKSNFGVSVDPNTAWEDMDTEFAFAARAEMLLQGGWKQFGDFAGWRGGETGVLIGGAVAYQKAEFGTAGSPEEEQFQVTADISMEFDGANLFASFTYMDLDVANVSPYGFVVQGGYFFSDDIEGFLRYEFGDADDASEDLSVITVGVNKYWAKHNLKWTTDIGFGLNEVTGTWDKSSVGWLTDSANQDGQLVFRSQVQLLF